MVSIIPTSFNLSITYQLFVRFAISALSSDDLRRTESVGYRHCRLKTCNPRQVAIVHVGSNLNLQSSGWYVELRNLVHQLSRFLVPVER